MEMNRKSNIIQTELELRRLDNFSPENHILYITPNCNIEEYDFKNYIKKLKQLTQNIVIETSLCWQIAKSFRGFN
jgi:hypothetical protein